MTLDGDPIFGMAQAPDASIRYLERTRSYYQALGYGAPYEWAHFTEGAVPTLAQATLRMPHRAHHNGRAVPTWQG